MGAGHNNMFGDRWKGLGRFHVFYLYMVLFLRVESLGMGQG